jgi:DNA-directed RNA polymerase subunit D
MKKVEETENILTFTAETSETLVNSLRRYVNQIHVLAIDEIEISKNDSPLYDEAVAHRAALVPLTSDKAINEKSTGKLKLAVAGEKIVHSGDMKGDAEVVYKTIPITPLAEGQELEFVATLKAGTGSEHAKFSPGLMFYRNVSEITLDKDLYDEVKKACPDNEIKEKGNKIIVFDNQRKEILDVCDGIAEKAKKKAEIENKDELVLTIESFGQISPREMLRKSAEALKKDLHLVQKEVEKA